MRLCSRRPCHCAAGVRTFTPVTTCSGGTSVVTTAPAATIASGTDADPAHYPRAVADHRVRLDHRRLLVDLPPALMRTGVLVHQLTHHSATIPDGRAVTHKPATRASAPMVTRSHTYAP